MNNMLEKLIEVSKGGKIFSVDFVKRTTGERRHMTCRTGVHKGLSGGELPYSREEKQLFGVFDMTVYNEQLKSNDAEYAAKLSYRNIPLESITHINSERV